MATKVIMPRQGQSVESCIMTKWFKKPGESVKKGEPLFSYETDKASFEEEAPENGTLLEIFFHEDDDVPVLTDVCVIGEPGEKSSVSDDHSDLSVKDQKNDKGSEEKPKPTNQSQRPEGSALSEKKAAIENPKRRYIRTEQSPEFDLMILGGGPGGYNAAERAAENGLKTCLIEEKALGGVCLNEGCIPTKTFLNSAKYVEMLRESAKYGVSGGDVNFNFEKILKRKKKVVTKLVAGVKAKMKHAGVEVVSEKGIIKKSEPGKVTVEAGNRSIEGAFLLIATGAEAVIPPIEGLDKSKILTSREILNIKSIPEKLTIIGGGVIGLEFADFFQTLGTSCTIIEMLPEILPGIDSELSSAIRKESEKKGIRFELNAKVTKLKGRQETTFVRNDQEVIIQSDEILLSIGRKPNTKGYGLENTGVALSPKGAVITDNRMRTNIANIFACGDINGISQLAHTAYREGETAVNTILGEKDTMRYNAIPGVVYTHPEVASVGLTEEEAKNQEIPYKVRKLPMAYAGRFLCENEGKDGFCKIITGKWDQVLGVHMIGGHSSEMIYGAAMMIEKEMTVEEIKEVVFPHPTVSEIIRETIFSNPS